MYDQSPRKTQPPQVDDVDDFLTRYTKRRVREEAQKQGVDPDLAERQFGQESAYKPDVIKGQRRSSAGAIGPGQLMPGTAKELGVDPYNIDDNISGSVRYMKQQLDTFGGDKRKALAAYNAGPGAVQKHGGVPPYKETQDYVNRIAGQQPKDDVDEFLSRWKEPAQPTQPKSVFDTSYSENKIRRAGLSKPERAADQKPAPSSGKATAGVFGQAQRESDREVRAEANRLLNFRTNNVQAEANRVNRRADLSPDVQRRRDEIARRKAEYDKLTPREQLLTRMGTALTGGGQTAEQKQDTATVFRPDTPIGQHASRIPNAMLKSAGTLVKGVGEGVPEYSPASALLKFATGQNARQLAQRVTGPASRAISQAAETLTPENPNDRSFGAQVERGAGSLPAFVAAGALGGPAGVAAAGVAMSQGQIAEEIDQYDAQQRAQGLPPLDPKRKELALTVAGLTGAAEAAGMRFDRFGGRRPLIKWALEMPQEVVQEGASQLANNLNAIYAGGYDPKRSAWEGVGESAAIGGVLGLGFKGAELPSVMGERSRGIAAENAVRAEQPAPLNLRPTATGPTQITRLTPELIRAAGDDATPAGQAEPQPIPAIAQRDRTSPLASAASPTGPQPPVSLFPNAGDPSQASDADQLIALIAGQQETPEQKLNQAFSVAATLAGDSDPANRKLGARQLRNLLNQVSTSPAYAAELRAAQAGQAAAMPYASARAAIQSKLDKAKRPATAPLPEQPQPATEPLTPTEPLPQTEPLAAAPSQQTAIAQPDTGRRLIERTRERAEQLIADGQFDEAVAELKAHQQALRDEKSRARKQPGLRTQIERQIGQAGNRIGEVRRMAKIAARRANKPTADLSMPLAGKMQSAPNVRKERPSQEAPPLMQSGAIVNPAGGVPEMPEQSFTGRMQSAINRQRAESREDTNRLAGKGLVTRIRQLGGINPAGATGELQSAVDKKYPGLINRRSGVKPDTLIEYLAEDGYDVDRNDLNTLWAAIDADIAGKTVRPAKAAYGTGDLEAQAGESISDYYERMAEQEEADARRAEPITEPTGRLREGSDYEGGEVQRYSKPLAGQPIETASRKEPVRAYHGTDANFSEFDFTRGEPHFTRDRAAAEQFAKGRHGKQQRIVEADVDIQNPAGLAEWKAALDRASGGNPRGMAIRDLRRQGFDGVVTDYEIIPFTHGQVRIQQGEAPRRKADAQAEAESPEQRRASLREQTAKGEFGKLSEYARSRTDYKGDKDYSLVEHPELRSLLGLPEMPSYRDESGKTTAWGKAAQSTMDALAELGGVGRSSELGVEGLRRAYRELQKRAGARGQQISEGLKENFRRTAAEYEIKFAEPYLQLHQNNEAVAAVYAEIERTYEQGKELSREQQRRLRAVLVEQGTAEGLSRNFIEKTLWPSIVQARNSYPQATNTDNRAANEVAVSVEPPANRRERQQSKGERPQPLFMRGAFQPSQLTDNETYADAAINIRTRTPKVESRANTLYGNQQADFFVNRAEERLRSKSDPDTDYSKLRIFGANLSAKEAYEFADEIRKDKYWFRDEAPDVRAKAEQAIDNLARQFEEIADQHGRVLYVAAAEHKASSIRGVVYHELAHDAERKYTTSRGWFNAQRSAEKIAEALKRSGYEPDQYVSESVAHILGGQWSKIDLTLDEAATFLDDYLSNIAWRAGREAVRSFNSLMSAPAIRPALRAAQEKHGPRTGQDDIQGSDRALPETERAAAERGGGDSRRTERSQGRTAAGREAGAEGMASQARTGFSVGRLANEPSGPIAAAGLGAAQNLFSRKPKAPATPKQYSLPAGFDVGKWSKKTAEHALLNSLPRAERAAYDKATNATERAAILKRNQIDPKLAKEVIDLVKKVRAAAAAGDGGTVYDLLTEGRKFYVKPKTKLQKVATNTADVLGLPRALMASADLSAPLRQGAILSLPPSQWGRAMKASARMFEAAFSGETNYRDIQKRINLHPDAGTAKDAGLYLSTDESGLRQTEEDFISRWAGRIPIVKQSERAYKAYLDTLRIETFAKYKRTIDRQKGLSADRKQSAYKAAADWINVASGRGSLGKSFDNALPVLSAAFFAPRYTASRIQVLNPMTYARNAKTPEGRAVLKQQMGDLVQFGGMVGLTLALAHAAGASIGGDPDDADFLKIRFGNTRYDFLAGLQQPMRLFYRVGKDVVNAARGRKSDKGDNALEVAWQFARSKAAPVPSYIVDMVKRKDFRGRDFDAKRGAVERITPLMWRDMTEAYQREGMAGAAKLTPGFFGIGVQDYEKHSGAINAGAGKFAQEAGRLGLNYDYEQPMKGEPPVVHKARADRIEGWLSEYGEKLVNHPRYQSLTPEQQKTAIRNLRQRIVEAANLKNPRLRAFEPVEVLGAMRRSEQGKPKRDAEKIYVEP